MSFVSLFTAISSQLILSWAQNDFDFSAFRAPPLSNTYILECVTDITGSPDRAARFLLNGTDVRDLGGSPVLNPDGSSSYLMTRELEGNYSCGLNGSEGTSNSRLLVGE